MSILRHLLRRVASSALPMLCIGTMAVGVAPALHAQVRPDSTRAPAAPPAQTRPGAAQQQAEMLAMAPMMSQMMQLMLQSTLAVLARPESAEQMATFTKNYFDALVAKGFTREEALRIVLAHGIPSVPTGR